MRGVDTALSRLACRQHGLFTREQAVVAGMTAAQIKYRLGSELIEAVHRGVYRVTATPRSWEQGLLAACLAAGPGAVASHRSAAVLWRLRGVEGAPVELTIAGSRKPDLAGVIVHRTNRLEPVDVTRRGGIPVTAPALTLIDLGAAVRPEIVESALEDAVLRGLVTFSWLQRSIERLGRPGRNGAGVLRGLLEARDPAAAPTESALEDLLVRVLRRGGMPEPVRQHWVRLPGQPSVRVDLAYPEARLAIEADSRLWHSGREDVQRNARKRNLLVAAGWRLLCFTRRDVQVRQAYVVEIVTRELARLRTAG